MRRQQRAEPVVRGRHGANTRGSTATAAAAAAAACSRKPTCRRHRTAGGSKQMASGGAEAARCGQVDGRAADAVKDGGWQDISGRRCCWPSGRGGAPGARRVRHTPSH